MKHRVQRIERVQSFGCNSRAARAGRIENAVNRRGFQIIHQQTAGLFFNLKPADIAISIAIRGIRRHPGGIKAVFRAVDRHEGAFAAGFHQAVAAAVCGVRQINGARKGERLQLFFDEAAEHALQTDRGHKCGRRARAAQNIGDIISAAADGELLAFRVQVFLGMGQVIDADDDIHAG